MGNVPAKEDQEINKLKDHGGGRRSANGNNSDPLRPKNNAVDSAPGVERHQIMTALKALRPTYEEEKLQMMYNLVDPSNAGSVPQAHFDLVLTALKSKSQNPASIATATRLLGVVNTPHNDDNAFRAETNFTFSTALNEDFTRPSPEQSSPLGGVEGGDLGSTGSFSENASSEVKGEPSVRPQSRSGVGRLQSRLQVTTREGATMAAAEEALLPALSLSETKESAAASNVALKEGNDSKEISSPVGNRLRTRLSSSVERGRRIGDGDTSGAGVQESNGGKKMSSPVGNRLRTRLSSSIERGRRMGDGDTSDAGVQESNGDKEIISPVGNRLRTRLSSSVESEGRMVNGDTSDAGVQENNGGKEMSSPVGNRLRTRLSSSIERGGRMGESGTSDAGVQENNSDKEISSPVGNRLRTRLSSSVERGGRMGDSDTSDASVQESNGDKQMISPVGNRLRTRLSSSVERGRRIGDGNTSEAGVQEINGDKQMISPVGNRLLTRLSSSIEKGRRMSDDSLIFPRLEASSATVNEPMSIANAPINQRERNAKQVETPKPDHEHADAVAGKLWLCDVMHEVETAQIQLASQKLGTNHKVRAVTDAAALKSKVSLSSEREESDNDLGSTPKASGTWVKASDNALPQMSGAQVEAQVAQDVTTISPASDALVATGAATPATVVLTESNSSTTAIPATHLPPAMVAAGEAGFIAQAEITLKDVESADALGLGVCVSDVFTSSSMPNSSTAPETSLGVAALVPLNKESDETYKNEVDQTLGVDDFAPVVANWAAEAAEVAAVALAAKGAGNELSEKLEKRREKIRMQQRQQSEQLQLEAKITIGGRQERGEGLETTKQESDCALSTVAKVLVAFEAKAGKTELAAVSTHNRAPLSDKEKDTALAAKEIKNIAAHVSVAEMNSAVVLTYASQSLKSIDDITTNPDGNKSGNLSKEGIYENIVMNPVADVEQSFHHEGTNDAEKAHNERTSVAFLKEVSLVATAAPATANIATTVPIMSDSRVEPIVIVSVAATSSNTSIVSHSQVIEGENVRGGDEVDDRHAVENKDADGVAASVPSSCHGSIVSPPPIAADYQGSFGFGVDCDRSPTVTTTATPAAAKMKNTNKNHLALRRAEHGRLALVETAARQLSTPQDLVVSSGDGSSSSSSSRRASSIMVDTSVSTSAYEMLTSDKAGSVLSLNTEEEMPEDTNKQHVVLNKQKMLHSECAITAASELVEIKRSSSTTMVTTWGDSATNMSIGTDDKGQGGETAVAESAAASFATANSNGSDSDEKEHGLPQHAHKINLQNDVTTVQLPPSINDRFGMKNNVEPAITSSGKANTNTSLLHISDSSGINEVETAPTEATSADAAEHSPTTTPVDGEATSNGLLSLSSISKQPLMIEQVKLGAIRSSNTFSPNNGDEEMHKIEVVDNIRVVNGCVGGETSNELPSLSSNGEGPLMVEKVNIEAINSVNTLSPMNGGDEKDKVKDEDFCVTTFEVQSGSDNSDEDLMRWPSEDRADSSSLDRFEDLIALSQSSPLVVVVAATSKASPRLTASPPVLAALLVAAVSPERVTTTTLRMELAKSDHDICHITRGGKEQITCDLLEPHATNLDLSEQRAGQAAAYEISAAAAVSTKVVDFSCQSDPPVIAGLRSRDSCSSSSSYLGSEFVEPSPMIVLNERSESFHGADNGHANEVEPTHHAEIVSVDIESSHPPAQAIAGCDQLILLASSLPDIVDVSTGVCSSDKSSSADIVIDGSPSSSSLSKTRSPSLSPPQRSSAPVVGASGGLLLERYLGDYDSSSDADDVKYASKHHEFKGDDQNMRGFASLKSVMAHHGEAETTALSSSSTVAYCDGDGDDSGNSISTSSSKSRSIISQRNRARNNRRSATRSARRGAESAVKSKRSRVDANRNPAEAAASSTVMTTTMLTTSRAEVATALASNNGYGTEAMTTTKVPNGRQDVAGLEGSGGGHLSSMPRPPPRLVGGKGRRRSSQTRKRHLDFKQSLYSSPPPRHQNIYTKTVFLVESVLRRLVSAAVVIVVGIVLFLFVLSPTPPSFPRHPFPFPPAPPLRYPPLVASPPQPSVLSWSLPHSSPSSSPYPAWSARNVRRWIEDRLDDEDHDDGSSHRRSHQRTLPPLLKSNDVLSSSSPSPFSESSLPIPLFNLYPASLSSSLSETFKWGAISIIKSAAKSLIHLCVQSSSAHGHLEGDSVSGGNTMHDTARLTMGHTLFQRSLHALFPTNEISAHHHHLHTFLRNNSSYLLNGGNGDGDGEVEGGNTRTVAAANHGSSALLRFFFFPWNYAGGIGGRGNPSSEGEDGYDVPTCTTSGDFQSLQTPMATSGQVDNGGGGDNAGVFGSREGIEKHRIDVAKDSGTVKNDCNVLNQRHDRRPRQRRLLQGRMLDHTEDVVLIFSAGEANGLHAPLGLSSLVLGYDGSLRVVADSPWSPHPMVIWASPPQKGRLSDRYRAIVTRRCMETKTEPTSSTARATRGEGLIPYTEMRRCRDLSSMRYKSSQSDEYLIRIVLLPPPGNEPISRFRNVLARLRERFSARFKGSSHGQNAAAALMSGGTGGRSCEEGGCVEGQSWNAPAEKEKEFCDDILRQSRMVWRFNPSSRRNFNSNAASLPSHSFPPALRQWFTREQMFRLGREKVVSSAAK